MSPGMSSFKILAGHQDLENSEHSTGRLNYLQHVANVPSSYILLMPLWGSCLVTTMAPIYVSQFKFSSYYNISVSITIFSCADTKVKWKCPAVSISLNISSPSFFYCIEEVWNWSILRILMHAWVVSVLANVMLMIVPVLMSSWNFGFSYRFRSVCLYRSRNISPANHGKSND